MNKDLEQKLQDFERKFIQTDVHEVWIKEAQKKYPYSKESFQYHFLSSSNYQNLFEEAENTFQHPISSALILGGGIGRSAFTLKEYAPQSKVSSVEVLKPLVDFSSSLQKNYQVPHLNFYQQDVINTSLSNYEWIFIFSSSWDEPLYEKLLSAIFCEEKKMCIIASKLPPENQLGNFEAIKELKLKSISGEDLDIYMMVKSEKSFLDTLNSWRIDVRAHGYLLLEKLKNQVSEAKTLEEKEKALNTFEKVVEFASDNYAEIFEVEATRLALQFEEEDNNTDKALKWYKKAAAAGSELAQLKLGLMYQEGKWVEENKFEAIKWLKMAADNGSEVALEYYSHLTALEALKVYGRGKNLENTLKALKLLNEEMILSQKKTKALFELILSTLSIFFLEHKVPEKDLELGFSYLKTGEKIGCNLVQKYIGEIAFHIANIFFGVNDESKEKNIHKAESYYQFAYEKHIPSSLWLYVLTLSMQNKESKVNKLLKSQSKEEKSRIFQKIFYLYLLGDMGIREDLEKAKIWLERIEKIDPLSFEELDELFWMKKRLD